MLVRSQVCPVPDLIQIPLSTSWAMLVPRLSTNGIDSPEMRVLNTQFLSPPLLHQPSSPLPSFCTNSWGQCASSPFMPSPAVINSLYSSAFLIPPALIRRPRSSRCSSRTWAWKCLLEPKFHFPTETVFVRAELMLGGSSSHGWCLSYQGGFL